MGLRLSSIDFLVTKSTSRPQRFSSSCLSWLWLVDPSSPQEHSRYDREVKIPLYAESGVEEVWLVEVNQQSLSVYRQIKDNRYQSIQSLVPNQSLSLVAFPEAEINLAQIFNC